MSIKINKNGKEFPVGVIPKNYPSTNIGYDNSQSGLSADNVQGAIDEVQGEIDNIADSGIWTHTVTQTEAADSVIFVSPQAIKAGAKKIIPTGCSAGGTLKPCAYHNNSGYFIISGMTPNEKISIFYVAIM